MLELLKTLILDSQETELPTGVPRRVDFTALPRKASVLIGVRRAGKSTFLAQQIRRLLEDGVPRENILYLNFFDDRLHGLQHGGLSLVLEAYFTLYPEKKNRDTVHFFFDEIQMVPGWEPFVDRLLRTEACTVTLTGSSAQMLSREIATQMRGRALPREMFPFSFREFLDHAGLDPDGPMSTRKRLTLRKAFDAFRASGGFPEVLELDPGLRTRIHQEYFNTMVFRDLIERHDVGHPRAVMDLAHWLMDHTGSLYSVNSLTGYLKALGHRIQKSSVSDVLTWFEDAYILFSVRIHDASLARAQTNPKKVYCIDHALVNSVSSGILVNAGHLLENLVFTALRRVTANIFYYKSKTGLEVDFVALMPDRTRQLVQVCETLVSPQTRKREVIALQAAMTELGQTTGVIVTRDEQETLEVDAGTIRILPAWQFLLELS